MQEGEDYELAAGSQQPYSAPAPAAGANLRNPTAGALAEGAGLLDGLLVCCCCAAAGGRAHQTCAAPLPLAAAAANTGSPEAQQQATFTLDDGDDAKAP